MWRTFAAAVITAVTLVLVSVQIASMPVDGGTLPTLVARGSCYAAVSSLSSQGATSGLRTGDVIAMAALNRGARLYLTTGSARVGSTFVIPLSREGRTVSVASSVANSPPWTFWLVGVLAKLIIYGIGSLVLWRGRDLAAAFFGISSLAIAVAIYPAPSALLPSYLQVTYASAAPCFAEIAALNFYLMIEWLAAGSLSRPFAIVARTIVFIGLAAGFSDDVFNSSTRIATGCVNANLAALHYPGYMAALVVTLAVLTTAYVRAEGLMRQRLRWIVVSTFVGFSGVLAYLAALLAGRPIPAYPIVDVTATAIPIGYAYAILRHRVIDVGFVLNRAIVFTAMTSLVVGAFALLSGVIERAAVGPGASVALQVAVALGLAFSFNALQKRVESAIDRVFFRAKHRAEAALAVVADETPFVRSADVLLERVAGAVRREVGSAAVAIYRTATKGDYALARVDGEGFPSSVKADDAAFVRLRTYLREVDLGDVASDLGKSGMAFPLAVQGRLIGAIACAPRRSDEPLDPDERASLRALAARVAAALAALRARELADLVRALADGSIDADAARVRAQLLSLEESVAGDAADAD